MPYTLKFIKSMSPEQSHNLFFGSENIGLTGFSTQLFSSSSYNDTSGYQRSYEMHSIISIIGTNGYAYTGLMKCAVPYGCDILETQNEVSLEFIVGDNEPSLPIEQKVKGLGFEKVEKPKTSERSKKQNPKNEVGPTILQFPVRNH